MRILKAGKQAIEEAVKTLKNGGVVVFPTETVYGIGALVSDESAIKQIFEIKKRPFDKPLQILISDIKQVDRFAAEISNKAREFMRKYWPGPMTLVFKKKPGISDLVTSSGKTVGLRMPAHPFTLELIREAGPMAASSANYSGEPDPSSAEEITIKAGLLIDGGKIKMGQSSTVIDVSSDPPLILREGKIHPF